MWCYRFFFGFYMLCIYNVCVHEYCTKRYTCKIWYTGYGHMECRLCYALCMVQFLQNEANAIAHDVYSYQAELNTTNRKKITRETNKSTATLTATTTKSTKMHRSIWKILLHLDRRLAMSERTNFKNLNERKTLNYIIIGGAIENRPCTAHKYCVMVCAPI